LADLIADTVDVNALADLLAQRLRVDQPPTPTPTSRWTAWEQSSTKLLEDFKELKEANGADAAAILTPELAKQAASCTKESDLVNLVAPFLADTMGLLDHASPCRRHLAAVDSLLVCHLVFVSAVFAQVPASWPSAPKKLRGLW